MDELILRTLVIQFDGRVVEVFGGPNGDAIRRHVALLKEPEIQAAAREGRSLVTIGSNTFGVDADELQRLKPLLEKIGAAVRTARNELRPCRPSAVAQLRK